jgi:hypothetical protein
MDCRPSADITKNHYFSTADSYRGLHPRGSGQRADRRLLATTVAYLRYGRRIVLGLILLGHQRREAIQRAHDRADGVGGPCRPHRPSTARAVSFFGPPFHGVAFLSLVCPRSRRSRLDLQARQGRMIWFELQNRWSGRCDSRTGSRRRSGWRSKILRHEHAALRSDADDRPALSVLMRDVSPSALDCRPSPWRFLNDANVARM